MRFHNAWKCFAAAGMAAVMAFSFAACGGNAGGSSAPSGDADSGLADAGNVDAAGTETAGAADAGVQRELTEITFALDWTPNTNHTGVYVAEELGYFAEAGLDVTIVQPAENTAELMVGSNAAQFGVSFQDTMMPAVVGEDALPITAVAAVLQHNTSGIVSRAGEGMDRPAGLEGQTYATWDLDIEKATIRQVMADDGGDFDQVQLIPSNVTDEVSALQTNSVDAIWIFYGWAGVACELADLDIDYFAFSDIDPVFDYYTPAIVGNTDWMEANPEAARAFVEALSRGYTFAAENPDTAAAILLEAAPELDAELVNASQAYLSEQYIDDASQWGVIDPARWNAFYNWINENGLGPAEIPENTGFTNDYLPE